MYKLFVNSPTRYITVMRLSDSANIPMVEDNKDYQEYLAWLREGNTPEPADDIPLSVVVLTPIEQAVILLLKLSAPISQEDIAMKDELTSKLQPK